MKTNTKIVDLIYEGFSTDLIKNLSEKQIDVLHSKLMEGKKKTEASEQTASGKGTISVSRKIPQASEIAIELTNQGGNVQVTEDEEDSMNFEKGERTQDPQQVGPSTNDGFDNYDDGAGMMDEASKDVKYQEKQNDKLIFGGEKKEGKEKKTDVIKRKIKKGLSDKVSKTKTMGLPIGKLSTVGTTLGMMQEGKKQKKNPWAICTAQLGKEFGTTERSEWSKNQMEKYENCVMDVKKAVKEGREVNEYLMEMEVERMLQKNVSPKMTKKDFLNVVFESSPATKPDTKPTTKPGTKPNPSTPYSPKPGKRPNPKAKGETNEQDAPTKKPGTKPTTKPGTKPNPSTPYSPKPGPKPNPKAGKKSLPSFLNWNKIGIRF